MIPISPPEILRCAQDDSRGLCHPERSEGYLARICPATLPHVALQTSGESPVRNIRDILDIKFRIKKMAKIDDLRLMTKVAHLYYEQELSQSEIATKLNLSQANISRLLKRALQEQIVRITVSPPHSVYTDLEEELEKKYALNEVIVVDSGEDEDEEQLLHAIGALEK